MLRILKKNFMYSPINEFKAFSSQYRNRWALSNMKNCAACTYIHILFYVS